MKAAVASWPLWSTPRATLSSPRRTREAHSHEGSSSLGGVLFAVYAPHSAGSSCHTYLPQEAPVALDPSDRSEYTQHVMKFFAYAHLPEHLQVYSRPVCELAEHIVEIIPDGPELTYALRWLLLSKDAFVRAALP